MSNAELFGWCSHRRGENTCRHFCDQFLSNTNFSAIQVFKLIEIYQKCLLFSSSPLRPFNSSAYIASLNSIISPRHAHKHSAQIRNQPDQPNNQAVPVKANAGFLITFPDHVGCPDGVSQHKP